MPWEWKGEKSVSEDENRVALRRSRGEKGEREKKGEVRVMNGVKRMCRQVMRKHRPGPRVLEITFGMQNYGLENKFC